MTASSDPAPGAEAAGARDAGGADTLLPPLLVIVGPTAIGKTALSLRLAAAFNGEVVSADSRLFYRGMDIGTAKPTLEERAMVPHHLIDIAAPDETVGLAQFHELATQAIAGTHARGRLPVLVGGTGQYVRSIVEGWRIPRVAPDAELRRQLEAAAERDGGASLHARLAEVDPRAAAGIDPRNVRRVIRALEVHQLTGTPLSELRGKQTPSYRVLQVGLTMPRTQLYSRADQRVDQMFASGLEAEVRSLIAQGFSFRLPAMSGLGYAQFEPYLAGEADLVEVEREVKRSTRRLIRHQHSWFRLTDPAIRWFEATMAGVDAAEDATRAWIDGLVVA